MSVINILEINIPIGYCFIFFSTRITSFYLEFLLFEFNFITAYETRWDYHEL